MRLGLAAGLAALLAACQPTVLGPSPAGLRQTKISVTTTAGVKHHFIVEWAETPEQQQRGLMFRESMAPDRGMIFPYDPPRPASFWMQNTILPLDLIFVAPGGKIESIAANAIPYSTDSIASQAPVEAVLEINGGQSAALGIGPGAVVDWKE